MLRPRAPRSRGESHPPTTPPTPETGTRPAKIRTDEITDVIKREIQQFDAELDIADVGQVVEVGDGMARVYGLNRVRAGELIEFQTANGVVMGQVMNLEADTVAAVLYGSSTE